jgi:Leucine-rich repeat (LRR) protein
VYLNLSSTQFVGKITTEIGNLKMLRYVDMSSMHGVNGSIPPQLGNISTLSFLSFGYGNYNIGKNFQWISNLNSLQYLDLSFVDLSSILDWFDVLNKLNNLKVIMLKYCGLQQIPVYVTSLNFTSLTTLYLSGNSFESPAPSWLLNLTSLSFLDLSNAFHGLSSGFWSQSKEPICMLKHLGLSGINITRNVNDLVREFACHWKTIEVLLLSNNNLHGYLLADWLTEMSGLTHLDLSSNFIAGVLPPEIVKLSKLSSLILSNNLLEGTVSQNILENLTQLQVLDLSLNMLKVAADHHWIPKFQLTAVGLQSCHVGPMFPSWLRSLTQVGPTTVLSVKLTYWFSSNRDKKEP